MNKSVLIGDIRRSSTQPLVHYFKILSEDTETLEQIRARLFHELMEETDIRVFDNKKE